MGNNIGEKQKSPTDEGSRMAANDQCVGWIFHRVSD